MHYLKKIFFAFTNKERVIFIIALSLAVISGSVIFGLNVARSTIVVPTEGGEYTEGLVGQPTYVNPVVAQSEADKALVRLVFSNLPDVADKIEASPDGRTWDVRLKDNVRWQDGEKLTSDDVIFTVQEIQNPDASSPLFAQWQGVSAERLSELELQFSLANPYAFFKDNLNDLYILPKHIWADTPPQNWKLSDYNLKPVGSGPYEFAGYEKRTDGFITSYNLSFWPQYFGTKPLINNFNFQFFTNSSSLIDSFNAGQIDAVANLDASALMQIKRPYEVFPFRLPNYYAVFLNQSKSLPLKDPAVRQALTEAVNRNDLILQIFGGHAEPEWGPIPQGVPYYDANIENASASLDIASDTLTAAGWAVNERGTREKNIAGTAIQLELNLTVPQVDFLQRTADYLAAQWQKIGIKTDINSESAALVANEAVQNRDYEMLLFGNILGPSSDLYSFWHSSERFYPGTNLSLYNDKNADALIETARQELDDGKREDEFNKLQETIVDDSPAVFLYSPDYLYVTDKGVHGIEAGFVAEPADILRSAPGWYLRTARVLK